jgi:hypothetical protein
MVEATMRVGWLVGCVLGLAGGVAQAQTQTLPSQTEVTVTVDRSGEGTLDRAHRMSSHAGSSLASRGSAVAAILAGQALEKDRFNPWAHYRRAAALSDQRRTDEAVVEYKIAEDTFIDDDRGKSLAMYGRAFTLAEAGRCAKAKPVFEQYAQFVEKKDPKGAALARSQAESCRESSESANASVSAAASASPSASAAEQKPAAETAPTEKPATEPPRQNR